LFIVAVMVATVAGGGEPDGQLPVTGGVLRAALIAVVVFTGLLLPLYVAHAKKNGLQMHQRKRWLFRPPGRSVPHPADDEEDANDDGPRSNDPRLTSGTRAFAGAETLLVETERRSAGRRATGIEQQGAPDK
jgi:hypothetical protein